MQVNIVAITGKEYSFELQPTDTVLTLKSLIWKCENIPPYHQGLIFRGKQIDSESKSLKDIGVVSGSKISLTILARSGPLKVSEKNQHISVSSNKLTDIEQPTSAANQKDGSVSNDGCDGSGVALDEKEVMSRAEENLRTMAKMREWRQNLERIKLEKKNRQNCGSVCTEEGSSRLRKPTTLTGGPTSCGRSFKSVPTALLSAPEDTSAKESSAGETEYEVEWDMQTDGAPISLRSYFSRHKTSSADTDNDGPSCHWMASGERERRYANYVPYKNMSGRGCSIVRVVSSSSEPESSGALWTGSDIEDDVLYTAEEGPHSLGVKGGCGGDGDGLHRHLTAEDFFSLNSGDSDPEIADDPPAPSSSLGLSPIGSLGDGETPAPRDPRSGDHPSDPSEVSSGVVICDLSNDFRRVRVKRRHHQLSGGTVGASKFAVDASPGVSGSGAPSRQFHYNKRLAAWRGGGGRPRSKPRQGLLGVGGAGLVSYGTTASVKPPLFPMSTGDSSSDERDGEEFAKKQPGQLGRPFLKYRPPGGATGVDGGGVVRHHKQPQSSQSQVRCNTCGCKLSIPSTFQCRCGKTLCTRHRYSDSHICSYDSANKTSDPKKGTRQRE